MMQLLILSLLISTPLWATIRPFETTRLTSTAGTGVASLLVNESAVLNPASIAFFENTFFTYTKTISSLDNADNSRTSASQPVAKDGFSEGFMVFDNSGPVKGGFSQQFQNEFGHVRKRYTATAAKMYKKDLALGVIYRYNEDKVDYSGKRHRSFHQAVFGLTYVYSPSTVFGFTIDDPFRAKDDEARAFAGAQYSVNKILTLLADYGGNYLKDFSKNSTYRYAAQINIFSDFFVRGGQFKDKTIDLKGTAWGVSWVGPKLSIDFAMKFTRQENTDNSYLFPGEKIADTSFTLSSRF